MNIDTNETNKNTVQCMYFDKKYNNKPQGFENAVIQKGLQQTTINIKDLAEGMSKGATFKPALLNGTKSTDFISQQLFALDFDHGTTIDTELNRCRLLNINPCFGYTSFSHSEKEHRFRVVFCTHEAIRDVEKRNKLQLSLISIFNNSDIKTKDPARLFYGGRSLICNDYNNMIDADYIIQNYYIEDENAKENKVKIKQNSVKGVLGEQDNNKDNLFYYISHPKPLPTDDNTKKQDNYYNIKAIADRNVEYLRDKLKYDPIILENNHEFMEYILHINLAELLEISYSANFKCLFHEDGTPSANIFQNTKGHYIYHCRSETCGVSYNILNIIEKLAHFKSRPKAYQFIRDIFNITIKETEWQKEQKSILMENIKLLSHANFKELYKKCNRNFGKTILQLTQLNAIGSDNVYSDKFLTDNGEVIFYCSLSHLCKQLEGNSNNLNRLSKRNVVFAYHGLLRKLDESEIPEDMLKRSRAISIEKGNKRSINFYAIPSYTTEVMEEAEKQAQKWMDNHYTMKGCSREMFFRGEGKEVADKLYPQFKNVTLNNGKIIDRTTSKISDERTLQLVKCAFFFIEGKGYCTEKDIVYRLSQEYSYHTTEIQIKKSLCEILNSYNLKRVRLNKHLKEKLNIATNGYPFVIIKEDEE